MVACQLDGQMQVALPHLEAAEAGFQALGKLHAAASVQVSKLIALAMLGRYDEAIACGLSARAVFVACADELSAGKIEQNLGNLYQRRDRYQEAEQFLRFAYDRYRAVGDQHQLAMVENCLALALASQHRFREARPLYERALERAAAAGLEVTLADTEEDLGRLALNQGQYDTALDFLERARRRFAALGMRHHSAGAEKQLADAYLELNLAPEAAAGYARAIAVFAELGMRADQAASLASCGRAQALCGQPQQARALLAEARRLFHIEQNAVGEATVTLTEAQLDYAQEHFAHAAELASLVEQPFAAAGSWGRLLLARWLRGDALRALGEHAAAEPLLREVLAAALEHVLPQLAHRCETSLGLLAAARGDLVAAEAAFGRAVTLIEDLRAPLPAEEFRTAFVADKLVPYRELIRLCLADPRPERIRQALEYVERARSRALVDLLGGALPAQLHARDPFEAELLQQLSDLREDLSWLYSQMNRATTHEQPTRRETLAELEGAVRDRETRVLEIQRQLQQRGGGTLVRVEPLDLQRLQADLGPETALVEYVVLDGEVLAFVVTDSRLEVIRGLGTEAAVETAIGQLRFQLSALRGGPERFRTHLDQLARRTRSHLKTLHDLLLQPVEACLGDRRLVVVPHRSLHYVPFHALFDGSSYLIERREVCYVPSAGVLRHCLDAPRRPPIRALLVGVPDERIPRVEDEVSLLSQLFEESVTLLGAEATRAALREHARQADIVHLACHGQFRPDNPLFSALRLGDGWLTVRDAYQLDLEGRLVTLSACETGAAAVAPGDEVLGLVRGFVSAGAPSLLVSAWTVDDAATASLMGHVYARLRAGDGPAAALRAAQCHALREYGHPFFWAPFAVFGRW